MTRTKKEIVEELFHGLKHFKPSEFSSPEKMSRKLLTRLELLRTHVGFPIKVTSSYRADSTTSHGRGTGVDLRCVGSAERFAILTSAVRLGFRRIGIYDKHVHLDVDELSDQDVVWWGKSE
jgi:hypothetical protein